MGLLIRIAFAVVVGILVTALLSWLVAKIPHTVAVLLGIVAGFIAFFSYPEINKAG